MLQNGADIYTFLTTTLLNFQIDKTYFYVLLDSARMMRELSRPWKRLQTLDTSITLTPTNTWQTPHSIPTNFRRLSKEGIIWLFNASKNKWQKYTEIPFYNQISYKDTNNVFFIDHYNNQIFFGGTIDDTYTVYFFYQADPGPITDSTPWINFPTIFMPILAYDVAAMYRLGADYDDINKRMGDENNVIAERLFAPMRTWDNELALSAVTQMDYESVNDTNNFNSGHINISQD